MRHALRKLSLAATMATIALFATACTGGGTTGSAPGANDPNGGTGGTTSGVEWTPGPLDEFQSRIFGWSTDPAQQETQAEAQARIDREGREDQEMIAACMAEQGFLFNVRTENFGSVIFMDELDGPAWGTREFAEIYGFGMANDPWAQQRDEIGISDSEVVWVDPNQELLDSMSDAERAAWEEALWGAPQDGDTWDPMLAGCNGQAQAARWPEQNVDAQFVTLQNEMDLVWQQMQNDPRLTARNAAWATCMASAGYPGFADLNALHQSLNDEWGLVQGWVQNNEIWGNWNWDLHPEGPDESDLFEANPADIDDFGQREIALAVANFDCQQQVNWERIERDVNMDLQQQFVNQHRDELEAWAQFAEASREGGN